MRYSWMLLGVLGLGCAGAMRGVSESPHGAAPEKETVYLVPLDEAMMMARHIFEERRYSVFEQENGTILLTNAFEPGSNPQGAKTFERFYVKGEKLGPRQSLVRVFRLRYDEYTMDNGGAANIQAMSARESVTFTERDGRPADLTVPGMGVAPNAKGSGFIQSSFQPQPFAGAPEMEGFKPARGFRELEVENLLLSRLERVPALEIVGGTAPAQVRSLLVESENDEASTHPAECGAPLAGAEPLLAKGGTLLLADPLGTRELPTQAMRLLCSASAQGPVALALALPASEQWSLDTYLASDGKPSELQELLLRGSFWRRDYQDGRGSHSMLWLIEQARRLRAAGRAVSLVAIDSNGASGNAREEEMAKNVLAFRAKHADAWMLVLAGGVHVRTGQVGWDSGFVPLGARLARALPSVKALDVGFKRGTQFACRYNVWEQVDCNVFAISPTAEVLQGEGVENGVHLFAQPSTEGFHGRLYVGALTASPPALKPGARAGSQQPQASGK
ncbi:hypothetical protein P2318_20015 [Myxococcaceae bacterium GXIMD 01537]